MIVPAESVPIRDHGLRKTLDFKLVSGGIIRFGDAVAVDHERVAFVELLRDTPRTR